MGAVTDTPIHRFDVSALYSALDARRAELGLTWQQLADLLGCTSSQLTGLRTARFATGMDLAMRIVQ
jgi:transcriptional regulator with XRE-family HTH domain